ncbi:lysylphosphatidylglycerol synthase transmembrane domain-containing protein [Veillonella agrestimuris]|uniref:lysylphosphatidylglycerol synthase transmembrane domain-containing protein n=1 Tax=Veillonella agrestimuris TaxID=2941340 RepID=UPI00203F4DF5|nr:lysylphosphatidylglycerol synthase transmembrane domain-containing protein [Veillonella agrestimuris]
MTKMMKRGIAMFTLLFAISIGIIYYTIDLEALQTLSTFNWESILLALLALALGMYFDGLRLQRLVKIGGYELSIKAVLRVIFSNYFMAMLTPGASGGAVAQVLVLKTYGVPLGKGTPIVLIRTVFSILFLVLMLPIIFLYDPMEVPYISRDMLLIFSILVVLATLIGTYALQTKYMRQFVYTMANRFKANKTKDWLAKLETLNQGFGLLYRKPWQSFVVFIESGLSLICLYCIAPALMFAFTTDVPIVQVLDRMIVLNLILYFAPTPGGAGVAEGLFVMLFAPYVPIGTVGIVAVAWRVVAEYVPFFIGMYGTLTLYGRQFVARETSS